MYHAFLRYFAISSISLLLAATSLGCSDDTASTGDDPDTSVDEMDAGDDGGMNEPDGGPVDALPDSSPDTGEDTAIDTGQDSGSDAQVDSSGMDTAPDTEPDMTIDPDGGTGDAGYSTTGSSSHINQVTFRQSESESQNGCCRDFDGDNQDDSALGDLIEDLSQATGFDLMDISTNTNNQISMGNLVFLLDFGAGWMSAMNDSGFDFFTHTGVSKAPPWDTDSDSVPEFQIDPASLNAQGQPKSSFGTVSVNQSSLSASNGTLVFNITLGSGMQQFTTSFTVHQAQLTGDVDTANTSLGNGGEVSINNGEVSGIINDDDLFSAINQLLAQQCSCLSGQDMFDNGGSGRYTCQNTCSSGGNPPFQCTSIGCSANQSIIYQSADADADGQGGQDDYTFGMEFTAQGADITGVGSP